MFFFSGIQFESYHGQGQLVVKNNANQAFKQNKNAISKIRYIQFINPKTNSCDKVNFALWTPQTNISFCSNH